MFSFGKAAKLLKLLERVLAVFSKCALKLLDNQADFDSAIPRFESSMPSQPQWSLACRFRCSEECRHSRGLAVKGPVSGEEYRASRTEGRAMAVVPAPLLAARAHQTVPGADASQAPRRAQGRPAHILRPT